jgi:hypothetical protein
MADNPARTAAGEDPAQDDTKQQKVVLIEKRPPAMTTKKKRKLKPDDFPKRPLCAYNIFFKETREKLLAMKESGEEDHQQGEGGNSEVKSSMVKHIASLWTTLDQEERERVERMAKEDTQRYKVEVQSYEEDLVIRSRKEREEAQRLKVREEARATESADRVNATTRRRGDDQQQGEGFVEQGRISQSRSHFEDPTGSLHGVVGDGEDMLERLLAEEITALEKAQSLKMRQLHLARRVEAANPHSGIIASLNAQRASRGLPIISAVETGEQYDIDTIGLIRGGGASYANSITTTRTLGSTPSSSIGRDRGFLGIDYTFPSWSNVSMELDALQRQQDEAMLRLRRTREQENRMGPGYHPRLGPPQGGFSVPPSSM